MYEEETEGSINDVQNILLDGIFSLNEVSTHTLHKHGETGSYVL